MASASDTAGERNAADSARRPPAAARPAVWGTQTAIPPTHSSAIAAIRANAGRHPTALPNAVAAGTPIRLATVSPRNSRPTADARRAPPICAASSPATPKNAPCGSPERNRATSRVPKSGAAAASPLPIANRPMNTSRRVRCDSRAPTAVSSGAPTTTPIA